MTLTKADIAEQIYKNSDSMTKAQATDAVEVFLRIAKNTLIGGSDLLLTNFGKFSVNDKRERKGRNPQTGETLILDSRRVITFHPSSYLKDKVNGR